MSSLRGDELGGLLSGPPGSGGGVLKLGLELFLASSLVDGLVVVVVEVLVVVVGEVVVVVDP